jgi:hypothetical protein
MNFDNLSLQQLKDLVLHPATSNKIREEALDELISRVYADGIIGGQASVYNG